MKTSRFLSFMAIFALAFTFFACSSDSSDAPGGGHSSSSPQQNTQVFCQLTAGTCSQMSLSTCMELVNAGAAQIVSSCSTQPPPPSSSSATPPPPPPSSSSATPTCGTQTYNPSTQFCSGSTVYAKCGGNEYNPSTYFCSGTTITEKCGTQTYNPSTQFCFITLVYAKCGGNEYSPLMYFCSGTTITAKCGGKEYNPTTQECTNSIVYTNFTDTRDNVKYKSVEIGTQTWMAQNLNYNVNGSKCPGDLASNCTTYGRQYNWATAMTDLPSSNANPSGVKGICPGGWHLPSAAEWDILVAYVGTTPGTKLKAASGWDSNSGNGTNSYGFAALPGGYVCYKCDVGILFDSDSYPYIGVRGLWWTATQYNASYAYNRYIESSNVGRIGNETYDYAMTKNNMLSVRCVKN